MKAFNTWLMHTCLVSILNGFTVAILKSDWRKFNYIEAIMYNTNICQITLPIELLYDQ